MRSSSHSCSPSGDPAGPQANQQKRYHGRRLYVVGIGPGAPEHLSIRAHQVLSEVEAVAGYTTYIELIRPLIQDKQIVATAMKKEVARVEAALDLALAGTSCALVSSGDPGIYAMAGLVFEMCKEKQITFASHETAGAEEEKPSALYLEVVPGIPALCAGASLLGAPLTHDFAAISLSDLLTPWQVIAKRLEAAAQADFVIVLYNPKSRKRQDHLEIAQHILLKHREPGTPVGIVTGAMRDHQSVQLSTLEKLHLLPVDMQTTVFIGNSTTFVYHRFMVTPRGYASKYDLTAKACLTVSS